jgi:hypothetical protein
LGTDEVPEWRCDDVATQRSIHPPEPAPRDFSSGAERVSVRIRRKLHEVEVQAPDAVRQESQIGLNGWRATRR